MVQVVLLDGVDQLAPRCPWVAGPRPSHLVGRLDTEQPQAELQRPGGEVAQRQTALLDVAFGPQHRALLVEARERAREAVQVVGELVELQRLGNLGNEAAELEEFQGQRPLGRLGDGDRADSGQGLCDARPAEDGADAARAYWRYGAVFPSNDSMRS